MRSRVTFHPLATVASLFWISGSFEADFSVEDAEGEIVDEAAGAAGDGKATRVGNLDPLTVEGREEGHGVSFSPCDDY